MTNELNIFNHISPEIEIPANGQIATLAVGCFWGVEHLFHKHLGSGKGLLDCRSGYTGGIKDSPNYKDVCNGDTQHTEAIQILFDPRLVSYKTLLDFFFRMHDPTTENTRGSNRGVQYRSVIFTHNQKQLDKAEKVKKRYQTDFYQNYTIDTTIEPIRNWWDSETYRQLYLVKNPGGHPCSSHFLRTEPPAK